MLFLLLTLVLNKDLTPGMTRSLTVETVCSTKWGLDRRFVTIAMKRHVAAAYGVPWIDRICCEFDHLIPRSLGGADNILNLWPQPWPEAKQKDHLEIVLGQLVCAKRLSLKEAQHMIVKDWHSAYLKYVKP